jgi:hypothetical protein
MSPATWPALALVEEIRGSGNTIPNLASSFSPLEKR